MGTQYMVRTACEADGLGPEIRVLLDDIEAQMSTYRSDSVLSRINRAPVGTWLKATPELLDVLEPAQRLSALSGGAFDVTVGPLVNLWGFGPDAASDAAPSEDLIAAARARVGYGYLTLRRPAGLRKDRALYIDLSAIAKGYAVDRVADHIEARGCLDYLVEVGGEVRVRGHRRDGDLWRIGIETPDPDQLGGVQRIIRSDGIAMATSGDYRNFFESDGRRYSHTIDPRTGYPVTHGLASVTVLHASTLWADGFATLLNVLGPTAGLELAEREGIAALFIEHTGAGFTEHVTSTFVPYLGN